MVLGDRSWERMELRVLSWLLRGWRLPIRWPMSFPRGRGGICGVARGDGLVGSGMCGPAGLSTGLSVRCGIPPRCPFENWPHGREDVPGELVARATARSMLVPWSHIPQGGWEQITGTSPRGFLSHVLLFPSLTSIPSVCRQNTVPPHPKKPRPPGFSGALPLFVAFWAGWRVSPSWWESLVKEGTDASDTSASPPPKVLWPPCPPGRTRATQEGQSQPLNS